MFECFWELWEGICENWVGAGSSLVTLTFKKGPTTVHFRPSDILLRSYNSHWWGVGWGKIEPTHWSHTILYLVSAISVPMVVLGVLAFSTFLWILFSIRLKDLTIGLWCQIPKAKYLKRKNVMFWSVGQTFSNWIKTRFSYGFFNL